MTISDSPLSDSVQLPLVDPSRTMRRPGRVIVGLVLLLVIGLASAAGAASLRRYVEDVPWPTVGAVELTAAFFDTRPLTVTTTASWVRMSEVVEVQRLYFDHTLWRRMYFRDWDQLPADVREVGVTAMLRRYRDLFATRAAGRRMSAADWDWIPQPVRAMAFVNMIEYWAATEPPVPRFDLPHEDVLRTLKAICMTESWFEHRAVNTNVDGSSDIGLPQASDYARAVTRRLAASGFWFAPPMRDDDYVNPWLATHWLVAWFGLMLEESGGDLELAIRSYNVGRSRARSEGEGYLRVVLDRRERYFEGPSGSATWQILSAFRREALAVDLPLPLVNTEARPRATSAPQSRR